MPPSWTTPQQQRLPWARPPPPPDEIWCGWRSCGCLVAFQHEVPNANEWRERDGVTRIEKLTMPRDHWKLREACTTCLHEGPWLHEKEEQAVPISVRDESANFTPAPEGTHIGVCVDVIDLGEVKGSFGPRHLIRLVWEIDKLNSDAQPPRPHQVMRTFGATLSAKGDLRPFLESWRGRKFEKAEIEGKKLADGTFEGFDVERLLGACCQMNVIHEPSADNTKVYANISAIMPLTGGMAKLEPSGKYIRTINRKAGDGRAEEGDPGPQDKDLPF